MKVKNLADGYCGPAYCPRFIRRWLSGKYNICCYNHDMDYINCTISRKEADHKFVRHMIEVSQNDWDVFLAMAFFWMVRIGGSLSYKKK